MHCKGGGPLPTTTPPPSQVEAVALLNSQPILENKAFRWSPSLLGKRWSFSSSPPCESDGVYTCLMAHGKPSFRGFVLAENPTVSVTFSMRCVCLFTHRNTCAQNYASNRANLWRTQTLIQGLTVTCSQLINVWSCIQNAEIPQFETMDDSIAQQLWNSLGMWETWVWVPVLLNSEPGLDADPITLLMTAPPSHFWLFYTPLPFLSVCLWPEADTIFLMTSWSVMTHFWDLLSTNLLADGKKVF